MPREAKMSEVIEEVPDTEGTCLNEGQDIEDDTEHGHVLCAYCGCCEKYCHPNGYCE
jgi:hypothetical protein